jgi:hypothetical protein
MIGLRPYLGLMGSTCAMVGVFMTATGGHEQPDASADNLAKSKSHTAMEVCVSARTPMPDRYFGWSKPTRDAIDSYRRGWLSACAGQRPGRSSLGELVDQAQALTENREVVEEASKGGSGSSWTWLPGIVWEYEVGELAILARQWSAASGLGSDQDRAFWDARSKFERGWWASPWWDARFGTGFETCMRLGEVDWLSEYRSLSHLREKSGTAYYRSWAAGRIKELIALLRLISSSKAICACRAGDASGGLERLATGTLPNEFEASAVQESAMSATKALKSGSTIVIVDYKGGEQRRCPSSAMPWLQQ